MENVFDAILEYYEHFHPHKIDLRETDAEEAFYNEVIYPIYEYNSKAGSEIEVKFSHAIIAVQNQTFRSGFKSGVNFLLECMGNK